MHAKKSRGLHKRTEDISLEHDVTHLLYGWSIGILGKKPLSY